MCELDPTDLRAPGCRILRCDTQKGSLKLLVGGWPVKGNGSRQGGRRLRVGFTVDAGEFIGMHTL